MDIRYNISELFELAFGIKNPFFFPMPINVGDKTVSTPFVTTVSEEEKYYRKSWMGTPIAFPTTFLGGSYMYYDVKGELDNMAISDFELPAATLIDFTRPKNIIKTPVLGQEGSVKELYSLGDWNIMFRGLCLTDNARTSDKTALEQKQRLLSFEQLADSIKVMGDLFQEKAIDELIIENMSIQQIEGKPNVYKFEMACVSDMAKELRMP